MNNKKIKPLYFLYMTVFMSLAVFSNICIADTKDDDKDVYIEFYDEYGTLMEDKTTETSSNKKFTVPDSGVGSYWSCYSDNTEKTYLIKCGDTISFKEGMYYMSATTNDSVTVSFFYPMDADITSGDNEEDTGESFLPGALYSQKTYKVGDKVSLLKSLGALSGMFGYSFQGWQESYSGDLYKGGAIYQIMDNHDLSFYAVYEYDENFDPFAKDQNADSDKYSQDVFHPSSDIELINSSAGVGYGAYIDSDGKTKRIGGGGIKGTIAEDKSLSSLIDGADPKDPNNYTMDKHGRKFEDTDLEPNMANVLKQDDSALYMDVYGNSFIYYNDLTRENNKLLALNRLIEGKTDSWASNMQIIDPEVVNRFEAVEFALLNGEYPEDGETLIESNGSSVVWKNEYCNKSAYYDFLVFKRVFQGWYDSYSDGLYDYYKNLGDTGTSTIVSKNEQKNSGILDKINNLFTITAYADEGDSEYSDGNVSSNQDNSMGDPQRIKSRVGFSLDFDGITFKPQYYNPNYSGIYYSLGDISELGLSSEAAAVLNEVWNYLTTNMGFSTTVAAGICGNLMQESTFDPTLGITNKPGSAVGLVQWMGDRKTNLFKYSNYISATTQMQFLKWELDGSYMGTCNNVSNKLYGCNFTDLTRPEDAAFVFCIAVEGCVTNSSVSHNGKSNLSYNNRYYQESTERCEYAKTIYNAMGVSINIGSFNGDALAIMQELFPNEDYVRLYTARGQVDLDYVKAVTQKYLVEIQVPYLDRSGNLCTRKLRVHKALANAFQKAYQELVDVGFRAYNCGGTYEPRFRNNKSTQNDPTNARVSTHSYGITVDINPGENPMLGITGSASDYQPGINPYSVTAREVGIMAKYGFGWGGNWKSSKDYMHFSAINE